MTENKPSLLPRLEVLIMIGFFLGFSIWAIGRCNATKEKYRQKDLLAEEQAARDSVKEERATAAETDSGDVEEKSLSAYSAPVNRYTPLYVCIDELKMRAEPALNSEVILKLHLYEEVTFMDEVTPFRDSISLGNEMAYEPWIKIRHRKGRTGWVYGAGVHYYKMKRE